MMQHVFGISTPTWSIEGLADLQDSVTNVCGTVRLKLAVDDPRPQRTALERALSILQRTWPAALLEAWLLIRSVVHIQTPGLRSATVPRTFGAMYAGAEALEDPLSALAALLRESAHHSLLLQTAFTPLLSNGDEWLGTAPGPDHRRVAGVLSSVHSQARIAHCFTQLCRGAPTPGTYQYRGEALAALHQNLQALRKTARWTDAGLRYVDDLDREIRSLTLVH